MYHKELEALWVTFRYERRIRETDLDFLGHVNHAKYLSMLEEARWEMISDRGYGLSALQEAMISPLSYKSTFNTKERFAIENASSLRHTRKCHLSKVGTLEQIVRKENGQIAARATITYGVMDLKQRMLIHPPSIWLKAIGVENEPKKDS